MYLAQARPLSHMRPDPAHDFRTFYSYVPNEVKHRRRTTRGQLKVLESVFAKDPKPNAALRNRLSHDLGMTPRAVQVWFQNRRAKQKALDKKGGAAGVSISDDFDPTVDHDDEVDHDTDLDAANNYDPNEGYTKPLASTSRSAEAPSASSSTTQISLPAGTADSSGYPQYPDPQQSSYEDACRASPSPSSKGIFRPSWHGRTHSGSSSLHANGGPSPASSSSSPIVSVPEHGYPLPPPTYLSPIPSAGSATSFNAAPGGDVYGRRGSMPNVALPRGEGDDPLARRGSMDHMRSRLGAHPYAHVALAANNALYAGGRRASTNALYAIGGHSGHWNNASHLLGTTSHQGLYARRASQGHAPGQAHGHNVTGFAPVYEHGPEPSPTPVMRTSRSTPGLAQHHHRPPLQHQPHTVPIVPPIHSEHSHGLSDSSMSSTPVASTSTNSTLSDSSTGVQVPSHALLVPIRALPPPVDGPLPESGYTFGTPSNGAASNGPHPDTPTPQHPQSLHPHTPLHHPRPSIPEAPLLGGHHGSLTDQLNAFAFPPRAHQLASQPDLSLNIQAMSEIEVDDTTTTASGSAASFFSSRFGSIGSIAGSESSATSAYYSSAGSANGLGDMDTSDGQSCFDPDGRRGSFASTQFPELFSSLHVNTSPPTSFSQTTGMSAFGVPCPSSSTHLPTPPQEQHYSSQKNISNSSVEGASHSDADALTDSRNGSVGSVGTVVGGRSSPSSTLNASSIQEAHSHHSELAHALGKHSVASSRSLAGQPTPNFTVVGASEGSQTQVSLSTKTMSDGDPMIFRQTLAKPNPHSAPYAEYDEDPFVSGTGHYLPVATNGTYHHSVQEQISLHTRQAQQHPVVEFGGQGQEVLQLHHAMEYMDSSYTDSNYAGMNFGGIGGVEYAMSTHPNYTGSQVSLPQGVNVNGVYTTPLHVNSVGDYAYYR